MESGEPGGPVILTAEATLRTSGPFLVPLFGAAAIAIFAFTGLWEVALGFAVVIAAASTVGPLRSAIGTLAWHAPTLELPMEALPLEQDIEVRVARSSRKVRDVPAADLGVALVCEEWVRWETGTGDDTSTSTKTEEVYRRTYTGRAEPTPDGLSGAVVIRVPSNAGAPSFDVRDNSVSWRIEAEMIGADVPKGAYRFDIEVSPILGDRATRTMQDS